MYLKQRLAAGECLIGALNYSNSPELLEYTAVGMDWAWWEAQHTHVDWGNIVHGVRAARAIQVPLVVRTWTHEGGTIQRILDTGADGLIVPMVDTPAQAAEIVSHCYFPPLGRRSPGCSLQTGGWGGAYRPSDAVEWNQRITLIVMIETPQAVQNAESIARVPGVDGLIIGAVDLALRLNRPGAGSTPHDQVRPEMEQVMQACRQTGKTAGVIALTPEAMTARIREGYRLISAGADVNHVRFAYQSLMATACEAMQAVEASAQLSSNDDVRAASSAESSETHTERGQA
jgi:4-hydroxy-2-oxoheptanedioate aldolase